MKLFQRIGTLGMAAAMVFSLASCGGSGEKKGENAADIVMAAAEKASDVKSMTGKMTSEISMKMGTETMEMKMGVDMSVFVDPMKAHMVMNVQEGTSGESEEIEMYVEQSGDMYTLYVKSDDEWLSTSATEEELDLGQFDANISKEVYEYAAYSESFSAAGKETINGVEADRYDGEITGQNIEKVMSKNESMKSFSDMLGSSGVKSMSTLKPIKLSIWIDSTSGYPVRCQVDMGDFMSDAFSKIAKAAGGSMEDLGMEISKALVTVDYSDFDAVEEFQFPENAIAA